MLLGVLTFTGATRRSRRCTRSCSAASRSSRRSSARSSCGRATDNVERRALQGPDRLRRHRRDRCSTRSRKWMMDDVQYTGRRDTPSVGRALPLRADRHRRHRAAVRDHRLLHVDALRPGQEDRGRLADRPRDEHHPGLAQGLQATALPALVLVLGILGAWKLAGGGPGHLRHRRRGHGPAVADRPDRRARRVRPDHRQRRRHRRDGRHARGGPQRHRPARRGRQHDQGRHQGLRDRLGRRSRRSCCSPAFKIELRPSRVSAAIAVRPSTTRRSSSAC